MKQLIEDIIQRFGGRPAGSEEERAAQLYLAETLKPVCDEVKVEEFQAPINAHFGSLQWFVGLFWLNLYIFSTHYAQSKSVAALLSVLNAVFFIWHFLTTRHVLDFLFPKKSSLNVSGTIEPAGEAKRTVVLGSHMDSVMEFQWWYHLKSMGVLLNLIAGFSIVLQAIYFPLMWACSFFSDVNGSLLLPYYLMILLAPAGLSLFFMHGEDKVDGAMDNLSAVVVNVELLRYFKEHPLQSTRIRFVCFGAEECGLRGSEAYVKANEALLKAENATVINLDGIKDKVHLTIFEGEWFAGVKYPQELIAKAEATFLKKQVPVKKTSLKIGGTDAASFAAANIPALSIVALDTVKLDPHYHTRLDTAENLNPEAMMVLKDVLIDFIENSDRS